MLWNVLFGTCRCFLVSRQPRPRPSPSPRKTRPPPRRAGCATAGGGGGDGALAVWVLDAGGQLHRTGKTPHGEETVLAWQNRFISSSAPASMLRQPVTCGNTQHMHHPSSWFLVCETISREAVAAPPRPRMAINRRHPLFLFSDLPPAQQHRRDTTQSNPGGPKIAVLRAK